MSLVLNSEVRPDLKLRVTVDGDAGQVVPDDLIHIIQVHLVQLLRLLFDADGEDLRGGTGLVPGPVFGLWSGLGRGGGERRLRSVVGAGRLGQGGLLDDGHVLG